MKRVHVSIEISTGYSSNETFKRFIDTINLRRVSKKIQNTRNLNYKYDATRENLPRNSRNARLITLIVKPFNRKTRYLLSRSAIVDTSRCVDARSSRNTRTVAVVAWNSRAKGS